MTRRLAGLACAAMLATACTTPAPVRQLATETARNVSIVNTRLRTFARGSETVAERRAAIVRELDASVTAADKELASKLEAMRLAGERDKLQRFQDLDDILKILADLQQKVAERNADLQKRIDESRSPLAPPVNPLTATENTLVDLGKAEADAARLQFYGAFLAEVFKDVQDAAKKQQDAKSAAEKAAESSAASKQADLAKSPDGLQTKP